MSCPNSTAPIDINLSNISGNCDLKCEYKFLYHNSACIATNRGDYLALSYDNSNSTPVIFNSSAYSVKEVRIYTPSLHSYSGSKADGEMIIIHTSNTGSKPLLVCVPIVVGLVNGQSGTILTNIINTVADNAPSENEATSVKLDNYNLSYFIPKKPFFSYSATEPYQPCFMNVNYVVFDPSSEPIGMSTESFNKLSTVITSNPYDIKTGTPFYYNEKGSGSLSGTGLDEIYIDCKPVGASDNDETVINSSGSSTGASLSLNDILQNPIVQVILGSMIFIILLALLFKVMHWIKPTKGGLAERTVMTGGSFLY